MRKNLDLIYNIIRVLLFSLPFMVIISTWMVQNKLIHQHFFFSTSCAYNSLVLYAAPVIADKMRVEKMIAK